MVNYQNVEKDGKDSIDKAEVINKVLQFGFY